MRWNSETFGRRLAQIRTNRRLTQQQLGVAIGKSTPTIYHWENDPFFEVGYCASTRDRCRIVGRDHLELQTSLGKL